MIRKLCALLAIVVFGGSVLLAAPQVAAVDVLNGADCGGSGRSSAVCQGKTNQNPVSGKNGLLLKIVKIIGIAAGVAAVIMIVIGGFQYLLSAGDATKAANARNTIIFAAVGLIVVVLAASILSFALNKIT
ncbi:MAG TPA: hypothetical protein VFL85_03580 [Candidatus Saccharimonadales bacterium]|nr:hypothetical protein [Candidatus Saccharimonadales bacterium]